MTTPYIVFLIICGLHGYVTASYNHGLKSPLFWLTIAMIIGAYQCGKAE